MNGLFNSLNPLWQKYKIEIALIVGAAIISLISIFIFLKTSRPNNQEVKISPKLIKQTKIPQQKIIVDLSGAVEKPDIYEVSSGARLKDILIMAGGLSQDADRQFFARNYNLAKVLSDQEKIYLPSIEEVENGTPKQNLQTFTNQPGQTLGTTSKININTASLDELDTLSGVGKITAQKIIQSRPYQSLEELVTKKVIGKSLFEKIKDLISL